MKKLGILIIIGIFLISFDCFAFFGLFEKKYNQRCDYCDEIKQCSFYKISDKKDKICTCLYYTYLCSNCYDAEKNSDYFNQLNVIATNDGRNMTNDWQDDFYKWVYFQDGTLGYGDISDKIPIRLNEKDNYGKAYNNLKRFLGSSLNEKNYFYTLRHIFEHVRYSGYSYARWLTKEDLINNNIESKLKDNEEFLKYAFENKEINTFYKKWANEYEKKLEERQRDEAHLLGDLSGLNFN